MKFLIKCFFYLSLTFCTTSSFAAVANPEMSFDVSATNIFVGDIFSVDVRISDVQGLTAFGFYEEHGTGTGTGTANYNGSSVNTLFRDDSAQSATPTVSGGLPLLPFPPIPLPIDVAFDEFFVLATLNFTALTEGLFEFNFFSDDGDASTGNEGFFITASSPFVGNEIDLAGSVNIQAAQVPEPPVILIMLIGLLGLAKTTKLRKI